MEVFELLDELEAMAEEGERWRFQVPMVGEWVKRQG